MGDEDRNITDADADAIAEKLEKRFEANFYQYVGKGVWGLVWRALLILLLVLAFYGAVGRFPKFGG